MESISGTPDASAGLSDQMATSTAATGATSNGTPDAQTFDFSSVTADQLPAELVSQHPNFKGLQSSYDKQISELRRQLSEAQRNAPAAINTAQQDYASRLQEILGDRLDESGQRDLQMLTMQETIQRFEAEKKAYEEQRARDQFVSGLAEQYGIDAAALQDVSNPMDAYEHVVKHQHDQLKTVMEKLDTLTNQMSNQQNAASHTPDLGGGAAPNGASQVQTDFNAAMKAGDVRLADNIRGFAAQNDLELDRFAWLKQSTE